MGPQETAKKDEPDSKAPQSAEEKPETWPSAATESGGAYGFGKPVPAGKKEQPRVPPLA